MSKMTDYQDFLDKKNNKAPNALRSSILAQVKKELTPSPTLVFSKITLVQAITGAISLTFCPQFQISLGANSAWIYGLTQSLGHTVCMLICGTIFLGSGALATGLFLSRPERKLVLKNKYLIYVVFVGLSLGLFFICGGQVQINMALAWAVGALLSGVLGLEASTRIKERWALA